MSEQTTTPKQASVPQASTPAPPRIYNAIYSAVQVFECMVRSIAVMRRRVDSYVNATQILKVAGIDKGRRTKILEKEILPGKHEIVQGGYGKYQGTWIPLERGRELATQFGVAPLLAPLFDYVAPNASMPRLPVPNALRNYQSSPSSVTSHPGSHQAPYPSTPQPAPTGSIRSSVLTAVSLAPSLLPGDSFTRFATEPTASHPFHPSILASSRFRAVMASISNDEQPAIVLDHLMHQDDTGLSRVDMVIDDEGHTILHWAANLSRIPLMEALVDAGADIHRGNNAGETPLIRSILSSAAFLAQSLPRILKLLFGSMRTVDLLSRSVLHHVALVAGVKTRAPCARYYMECILEHVARNGGAEGLRRIVDLQDLHGDTALNLAARVGNRSLVRNLIDVGANTLLANKLGLQPGDFGIEDESLDPSKADDTLFGLRNGPIPPAHRRQDVSKELMSMIDALNTEFIGEVDAKQRQLGDIQNQLRTATRELAAQRKHHQRSQATCAELDEVLSRIKNVKKAIKSGQTFNYVDGAAALSSNQMNLDPYIPEDDSPKSLASLRRIRAWHAQVDQVVSNRINFMKGRNAEKEMQCKKLVSLCTGVPLESVEPMLENLVIAMESDGNVPELGRISGFMQKVKSSTC